MPAARVVVEAQPVLRVLLDEQTRNLILLGRQRVDARLEDEVRVTRGLHQARSEVRHPRVRRLTGGHVDRKPRVGRAGTDD